MWVCACPPAAMAAECVCLLADLGFSLSDEQTPRPSIRRARLHQIPRCHRTQSVRSARDGRITSESASALEGERERFGISGMWTRVKGRAPSRGVGAPSSGPTINLTSHGKIKGIIFKGRFCCFCKILDSLKRYVTL